MGRALLGELMVHHGLIDRLALGIALRHQQAVGGRLGEALVTLGLVSEEQLADTLGHQLGVPVVRLAERTVPRGVLNLVPEHLLRRHLALPVWIETRSAGANQRLVVAFSDPRDVGAIDEIRFAAGMPLRVAHAGKQEIAAALDRHFGGAHVAQPPPRPVIELLPLDADAPMMIVDVRETRAFRAVEH